jgi:hypothetical protein
LGHLNIEKDKVGCFTQDGHDRFPPELVDDHLEPLRRSLGLAEHEFLGLGRIRPEDHREALCMTVLAFKMSRYANGVSSLHGRITRKSWQVLWPHHREDEVPVGHITNGVHVRTWLARLGAPGVYVRPLGEDLRALRRLIAAFGASAFIGCESAVCMAKIITPPNSMADIAAAVRRRVRNRFMRRPRANPDTRLSLTYLPRFIMVN